MQAGRRAGRRMLSAAVTSVLLALLLAQGAAAATYTIQSPDGEPDNLMCARGGLPT
jgi:hypothetical protein